MLGTTEVPTLSMTTSAWPSSRDITAVIRSTVSREIADSIGLERPAGALVASIQPKSPAEGAGLRRGDVITAVDNLAVDDPEAFGYRLGTRELGGTASLTILRNGKPATLSVRLAPAPETPARESGQKIANTYSSSTKPSRLSRLASSPQL